MRDLVDYARSLVGVEYSEADVPLGVITWATLEDHRVVVRVEPRGCCGDPFEAVVGEICYNDNWPYGPILHPIHDIVLDVVEEERGAECPPSVSEPSRSAPTTATPSPSS